MKKYLTIVMLSILLAPFMARMFYTTFFYFNQSSIARELCINRNVAGNSCQGACFLKKKLKQLEHSETSTSGQSKPEEKPIEKLLFTDVIFSVPTFSANVAVELTFQEYTAQWLFSDYPDDIFHPPLV